MVFQPEAHFRQLYHCNFRENGVKLLYIPKLDSDPVFLIVNKYGKIGLYDTDTFAMVHTYILDLTVPMHPGMDHDPNSKVMRHIAKYNKDNNPPPKCQQTHLVVDAVYCHDFKSCLFLTSKGILQCYDIGEIETQSIGLELLPRKRFMGLKYGRPILPIRNHGHCETHRLYRLREFPTCMFYSPREKEADNANATSVNVNAATTANANAGSQLLIGDTEGCITIILVDTQSTGNLFGLRKIRGKRHELNAVDLFHTNVLKVYKGHNGPVKQLHLLRPRQFVISCCATDRKYSLFVNDLMVARAKPYVVSSRKGINTFAHSTILKLMATGSNDFILRLFNDFITQMPQMELTGHKAPILAVKFVHVSFIKSQILLSYSKDVELRAWDPVNFVCLQSMYISFPPKSGLICKTPEFAQNCLYVHQPHHHRKEEENMQFGFMRPQSNGRKPGADAKSKSCQEHDDKESKSAPKKHESSISKDGDIILFYCNSYTKIYIEKDSSAWPFDFDDLVDEFEEAGAKFDQKVMRRQKGGSQHPMTYMHPDLFHGVEQLSKHYLVNMTQDILDVKKSVDRQLGIRRTYEFAGKANPIPNTDSTDQLISDDGDNDKPKDKSSTSTMAMSLGTRALQRYHSLERAKKDYAKTDFVQQGIAFKTLPLYEIKPIKFQHLKSEEPEPEQRTRSGQGRQGQDQYGSTAVQNLSSMPITDEMRAFGINAIQCVADLTTPVAKEFFSSVNIKKVQAELQLTEQTLRDQIEGLGLEINLDEDLAREDETGVKSRKPRPSSSGSASASASNATTISSFSSKLIQESNPTLEVLGLETFTSKPTLSDGDGDAHYNLVHVPISSPVSESGSTSAKYEDNTEENEGQKSISDEIPDLVSDVDVGGHEYVMNAMHLLHCKILE